MKRNLCFLLLLALLFAINCQAQTTTNLSDGKQGEKPKKYGFPLTTGWYWEYTFITEDQDPDGKETLDVKHSDETFQVKITRTKMTLKAEIKAVQETNDFIVAQIAGNPLEFCHGIKAYGDYCLALDKTTGHFWSGSTLLKDDLKNGKKLDSPKDNLFLILPLKIGLGWGDDPEFKRQDHWYQWYVEDWEEITVPAGKFKCLRLAYRTCPDHHLIWFCPEVGIVKQEYVHHGTVINAFMELTAYGPKK